MRWQSQQIGWSGAFEKTIGNYVITTVWGLAAADVADRNQTPSLGLVCRPFVHSSKSILLPEHLGQKQGLYVGYLDR